MKVLWIVILTLFAAQSDAANLYDIPTAIHRAALQHAWELGKKKDFPEWQHVHLADTVVPIWSQLNANGDQPSAFEFKVLDELNRDAGFIEVTVDGSDYLIPHWSTRGPTPTERVRQRLAMYRIEHNESGKFVKVDALEYSKIDAEGKLLEPRLSQELNPDVWAKRLRLAQERRDEITRTMKENSSINTLTLVPGQPLAIPALSQVAQVLVGGQGTEQVLIQLGQAEATGIPLIMLKVPAQYAESPSAPSQFDLTLVYETTPASQNSIRAETLKIRIASAAESKDDDGWEIFKTPGPSPKYNQIPAGDAPNSSECLSGCGATAWAMLLGWADIQASVDPSWAHAEGVFRAAGDGGPNDIAPAEEMNAGIRDLTWNLRLLLGSWCYNGQGATFPGNMGAVNSYLTPRTPVHAIHFYNVFGSNETRLKNHVIASIVNARTPAILGVGWLEHYPLATAYARKEVKVISERQGAEGNKGLSEWFYVNQGWGGQGDDWIAAATWFAGTLEK